VVGYERGIAEQLLILHCRSDALCAALVKATGASSDPHRPQYARPMDLDDVVVGGTADLVGVLVTVAVHEAQGAEHARACGGGAVEAAAEQAGDGERDGRAAITSVVSPSATRGRMPSRQMASPAETREVAGAERAPSAGGPSERGQECHCGCPR
jgi:hypothetical protein